MTKVKKAEATVFITNCKVQMDRRLSILNMQQRYLLLLSKKLR